MLRVQKLFRGKTKNTADGQYPIKDVHSNGTVTLDKEIMQEQVSIRRVFPW